MRLKTISVNGRRLSAKDGNVYRMNSTGSQSSGPELSFDQMDLILAHMEARAKAKTHDDVPEFTKMWTKDTGYEPEFSGYGEECYLSFGCWTVGNTKQFKGVIEQLKEINKDPEAKPSPDVFDIGTGMFVGLRGGSIWTVSEDGGTFYDEIVKLEDMPAIIREMEHIKQLPVIIFTGSPPDIKKDGDAVTLRVGCMTVGIGLVKGAVALLTEVQKKQATAATT